MILFVCTGNTCRSPMAEAIFNLITKKKSAFSRGMSVSFSSDATENSKSAIEEIGGTLSNHKSQQISIEDIQNSELVITMTKGQKFALSQYADADKLMTLSEFAGEEGDVPDPYGGDLFVYKKTAKEIYDYILKGIKKRANVLPATEEDLSSIVRMENEIFPDGWSEKAVSAEIKRNRVSVLKSGDILIGYCIYMVAADEGEILRIAVDRTLRLGGFGKMLLKSVIEKMGDMSLETVFLEVRASNIPAKALYTSLGFTEIGVRKGYYGDNGEDATLFNLKIKER